MIGRLADQLEQCFPSLGLRSLISVIQPTAVARRRMCSPPVITCCDATSKTFTRHLADYPRSSGALRLTHSHKSDLVISSAGEAADGDSAVWGVFSSTSRGVTQPCALLAEGWHHTCSKASCRWTGMQMQTARKPLAVLHFMWLMLECNAN